MNLAKCAKAYSDFFSHYDITTKISVDDEPLKMHQVQGVGHVDDLDRLMERCERMSVEDLLAESERFFDNSFVAEAFFYYAIAGLKQGNGMTAIADEFMRRSTILDTPYVIHQLHGSWVQDHASSLFVFLDWDGTLEVHDEKLNRSNLRSGTLSFLSRYKRINKDLRMHKYRFLITSASPNIHEKVKAYPRILELVDGIVSIPGIARLTKQKNQRPVLGKLYTDICKRLGIPFSRAIAVTDYWVDRSVENTFPINTIVTPERIPAGYWARVMETFERKGDGNLYMGFTELRRKPYEFRDLPILDTGTIDSVRTYIIGDDISLYRSTLVGDCFFIYPGTIPGQTPDSMKTNLQSIYRIMHSRL